MIDFLAFGDELEKIAASALLKRLRAGLISPEEALAASRKVVGNFGPGMAGQQNLPVEIAKENLERLVKIKAKRFMRKGMSEKEALRAARASAKDLAGVQRQGELRTHLQSAAAKARGATEQEQRKLQARLAKEKQVLLGESRPEVLAGGWKNNQPTAPRATSVPVTQRNIEKARAAQGHPLEPARGIARSKRRELEDAAARLGMKKDLSGTTAHKRVLRGEARTKFIDPMIEAQRRASLDAVPRAPAPAASTDEALAATRAQAREARLRMRQEALDAAPPPPAAAPGIDPAVQARAQAASQRMAQQQEELRNLQQRTATAPAPAPAAPAATPAATPTATPSPSPAPTSGPPAASAQNDGGMSPAAIAGLGLGAAGVVGAGAYGVHRLRQRQLARQAQ